MFDIDSVKAAMGSNKASAANKELSGALDLYKNKKDPQSSIPLFKRSILLNPTAKAYYELGSACLDNGQIDGAIQSFRIAEQLEYKPMANVMYKLAAAYAAYTNHQNDDSFSSDSVAIHYMEIALQMGYAHPDQFRSSPYFSKIRNIYQFNNTYLTALGGNKDPDKILWDNFQQEFQSIHLPLTINTVWIAKNKMQNPIAFDFEKFVPEMRNAKFSREVEDEYYAFAIIKKDTAYTTLLYAGQNTFLTDASGNQPVFFLLVTYDHKGRIIDKMQVAGQRNFTEVFKVFTIQPNYAFEIKDYKNIFKEDPEKIGYDSNYVVRSELQGTANFRIAAGGKFEKTEAPLAMR
jgi:tetratricopeptide (TPR) repeat protein